MTLGAPSVGKRSRKLGWPERRGNQRAEPPLKGSQHPVVRVPVAAGGVGGQHLGGRDGLSVAGQRALGRTQGTSLGLGDPECFGPEALSGGMIEAPLASDLEARA